MNIEAPSHDVSKEMHSIIFHTLGFRLRLKPRYSPRALGASRVVPVAPRADCRAGQFNVMSKTPKAMARLIVELKRHASRKTGMEQRLVDVAGVRQRS